MDDEQLIERQIEQLAGRIEQLKVDFQRFFHGNLDQPPEELRDAIQGELRRLHNVKLRRSVDRFRIVNLEAQFNSYNEMFNRRIRLIEEGRLPQVPKAAGGEKSPRPDVERGVVVGSKSSDGAVEALFQGLVERSGRSNKMDLDTFRSYLDRQVQQIQQKTGCKSVQFRLVKEDGKVKIKAKPVTSAGQSN